jgi:MtrB/PioB family decaheme-associated outer membrane protein
MNTSKGHVAVRASVLAVRAAVFAMAVSPAVYAADPAPAPVDPAVVALTQPTNFIEAGVGYVTDSSFKFGQFNGLFDKGPFGIFNFDIRDGTPYDTNSAVRWRVVGTNLGLDTRTFTAEGGQQGTFRLNVGFDELRSNYTDSYQTPFLGNGTNLLTLPANWLKPVVPQANATSGNFRGLSPTTGTAPTIVGGVVTQPTPGQLNTVGGIIAADVPSFNNLNLDTVRKVYSGGLSYNIDPRWELKVSASQTQQNGLKALNMISLASGTFSAVLPNLIDQTTNQYNASINYAGQQFYFNAAYYGSYFTNNVGTMTFDNAFAKGTFSTMSTAPSNEFNQFTVKGGYNFSPTTKLVVGASYGRNTQNDQYVANPTELALPAPVTSLDGLVITEMFNARLTAKPIKGLSLGAGYTFNNRDNQTPVNTYAFYDAGEAKSGASPFNATLGLPAGTLGSNINIYANRPYSKKVNTAVADAEYMVAPGQNVKGAYEYQQIDRDCPGSWINCADATQARENTLRVAYDGNISETFSARVNYAYSQRRVDYDPNAWLSLVPMANFVPGAPTVGATSSVRDFLQATGLGGYGPNAPYVPLQPGNLGIFFPNNSALPQALYGSRNDIHEIPGMMRFNMADRDRNKIRATLDWQAMDALSIQAGAEYVDDNYTNSVYGLESAKTLAVNLEGTWQVSEDFSTNLFYTYQDQKYQSGGISYSAGAITNTATVGGVAGNTVVSGGCFATVLDKNMNAKIDPCLNWNANERDKVNTLGVGFNWKGLMARKLDIWGDAVFTWAKTSTGITGGTYANSPFAVAGRPAVVPAAFFIPAADMPDVTNNTIELRLVAQYNIDKKSAVRFMYMFGQLRSTDYAYDGMQYGTITSVLPTNQTAPNYNVSVFGLSYVYSWQ